MLKVFATIIVITNTIGVRFYKIKVVILVGYVHEWLPNMCTRKSNYIWDGVIAWQSIFVREVSKAVSPHVHVCRTFNCTVPSCDIRCGYFC